MCGGCEGEVPAVDTVDSVTRVAKADMEKMNAQLSRDEVWSIGAYSPMCVSQPGSMWRRLADQAEALGDVIGANDAEAANTVYRLAGRFMKRWEEASR
ncbi:hypothetical protein SEA_SHROOMBOI_36 [Mycobacterium phage ShroomBoi]|nr:hypothetical protein SEA_SHROOMBOI_36 [Mycobacterium phage ShroomBoi]